MIIDEAFIELTVGGNRNSAVDFLTKYQHLFIIRAFTKILAVPGLRLGYGLGDQALLSRMRTQKLPWSVNLLADSVGEYLSQISDFLAATSQWLAVEKNGAIYPLGKISGLKPFPGNKFYPGEIAVPEVKRRDSERQISKEWDSDPGCGLRTLRR